MFSISRRFHRFHRKPSGKVGSASIDNADVYGEFCVIQPRNARLNARMAFSGICGICERPIY